MGGWQTLWPKSWGFWLWVLTSSGRTAGEVCCISVQLWEFPHSPARSVWTRSETNTISYLFPNTGHANSFNKVQHTCRFHSVLHRCARWLLAALFLNKKTVLDNDNSKYLNAFLSPNNNKLAQHTLKYTYLQFTRFPTNTVSFKRRILCKILSNNPYYYYYHLYIFCDVHALRGSRANAAWFKCERNRAAPASAKNASPPDARLKSLQR